MIRHFNFHREVEVPFDVAAHILRDEPAVLLGLAREAAIHLAESPGVAHHVMTSTPTPRTPHDVEVILDPVKDIDEHALMVPVTWTSVDGVAWFPHVEGEIEVSDLDNHRPWCDVSFFGSYQPRYGFLGAVFDLTALHGPVEESLQHFLDLACDHLIETAKVEAAADEAAI